MTDRDALDRWHRAAEAVTALADHYAAIAKVFADRAAWLRSTPLEELRQTPPRYLHHATRALEDALDEALMAL